MTSCQNCGHDSHCGSAFVQSFPLHTEGESIIVCQQCRCELCVNEEKTQS